MCILTDSMSSIAEEIIIEEGQGSHIVSILEDGCLGNPLIFSTKVNAMKENVVATHSSDMAVSDKCENICDLANQGVDSHRQPRFSSLMPVESQQPKMAISGENANGRRASTNHIIGSRKELNEGVTVSRSAVNFQGPASCNFLETREDAPAFNATSRPAPNNVCAVSYTHLTLPTKRIV